jgi:hypothetical protein
MIDRLVRSVNIGLSQRVMHPYKKRVCSRGCDCEKSGAAERSKRLSMPLPSSERLSSMGAFTGASSNASFKMTLSPYSLTTLAVDHRVAAKDFRKIALPSPTCPPRAV